MHEHEDVGPVVDALRAAGIGMDGAGLRRVGRLLGLEPSFGGSLAELRRQVPADDRTIDHAALAIVADGDLRARLETLLPFWRAKALIEDYHMKPAKMLEVMRLYGPMDWRHPGSHAAYFGYLGVQMAGELRDNNKIDVLNTARGDIQAVQLLMEGGNVAYNPLTGGVDLLPDPRFIPAYDIAWDRAVKNVVDAGQYSGQMTRESFAAGHENFLLKAMLYAYFYGDEGEAQRYFNKARSLYGETWENQRSGRYNKTLEDLIFTEYASDWSMPTVMLAFVESNVQLGIVNGLRVGRGEVFNRFVAIARQAYERHRDQHTSLNVVTGQSRLDLSRSWEDLMLSVYVNVMQSPQLDLLDRSSIWFNTPTQLQLAAYAQVRGQLRQESAAQGIDFDRAFPMPEGFVEPQAPARREEAVIEDIERK